MLDAAAFESGLLHGVWGLGGKGRAGRDGIVVAQRQCACRGCEQHCPCMSVPFSSSAAAAAAATTKWQEGGKWGGGGSWGTAEGGAGAECPGVGPAVAQMQSLGAEAEGRGVLRPPTGEASRRRGR